MKTFKFGLITLFPEMFSALDVGIVGRAQKNSLINLSTINPRDFTQDKHKTVDDRPYGGGPGMVMMVEPLRKAIHAAKQELGASTKTIFLSPKGKPLTQAALEHFSKQESLILLAGRYEGIDERLIEHDIDELCSIGDYVLSGGELAAMVMIDGITRLLPDALGDEQSAENDSFSRGLLDHPHYTRPESIDNQDVPKVLLSGDHKAIERWRLKQALGKTWKNRPDLLESLKLSSQEQLLLNEYIKEH